MKKSNLFLFISFLLFFIYACHNQVSNINVLKEPHTIEELGELLFNDSLLSRGNQISCASCHKPNHAFADDVAFSFGVDSAMGSRNTPSAMNQASRNFFFHDGRSESLEDQAVGPIENPIEMDIPLSEVVRKLNKHPQYPQFFSSIFGKQANKQNVVDALVAYEKSLETSNSAFDNYMNGKDTTLFTEAAKRGQKIFNVKGKCFDCHFGPDFTGDEFRNIGLFNGQNLNDSGRYVVTKRLRDIGRFKVPGLRNSAITKPYMHNGQFKTLMQVIDYYNEPNKVVSNSINRDTLLSKPLNLTAKEKKDLEAFLESLTDKQFLK